VKRWTFKTALVGFRVLSSDRTGKNIARVFFFFGQGQELILTHGYVKKQQKVDARELERARSYKKDWKQRHQ
jgi:phage-related protein